MSRSRSTAAYSYSSILAAFFISFSSRSISCFLSCSVIFTPPFFSTAGPLISSSSRTLLTMVLGTMPCSAL